MRFRITSPQTPELWRDYYALRWEILRAPWQQPPGSERDEFEDDAWHVMAVDAQDKVIGVGRLHRLDEHRVQIRYMAVKEDARGQGVGGAILAALEAKAQEWQAREIVLNARTVVKDFYFLHQYEVIGPSETLFGCIPHVAMHKFLLEP